MNTNFAQKSSIITVDNKALTSVPEIATKRAVPDHHETSAKKNKVDHFSDEKNTSDVVSKSVEKSESALKPEIATGAHVKVQSIPEISDGELLEMAIQFELKYPQ